MKRRVQQAIVRGHEQAALLTEESFLASFKDWDERAPFTTWNDMGETSGGSGKGILEDHTFREAVRYFENIAAGPPAPKGKGKLVSFGTSKHGGSTDAECTSITWLLLDNDDEGLPENREKLTTLLKNAGVAFFVQTRGPKWHLHIPLAYPIVPPAHFDSSWKKQHVERFEWITGVFSALADLKCITTVEKPKYGFDPAIPSLRLLGLCYPYTRRTERDAFPTTEFNEGRALDPDALLEATKFIPTPENDKHRAVPQEEVDGRVAALKKASLHNYTDDVGKHALFCPWSTHFDPQGHEPGSPTATIMFANGIWHCSHATCRGRTWQDVMNWMHDNKPDAEEEAWRSSLIWGKDGLVATVHNALLIFEHDPSWQNKITYNEREGQIVIKGAPPWTCTSWVFNDAFLTRARSWLMKQHRFESSEIVRDAIDAVARAHGFDPVYDYLRSLKWDGQKRLRQGWLTTYCGAEDTPLTREIGMRWLISAVARVFKPGCQVDHVLVLEGAQGVGKSSIFRILGGEWFSESLHDIGSKTAAEQLQGKWIVELAELASIRGNEIEAHKAFLTKKTDDYRAPYAHVSEARPRRCVFGGTTNAGAYLDDETGNRRYWPVRVGSRDTVRLADLERDRDQLFAEAVILFEEGAPWHLVDNAHILAVQDAQAQRVYVNPWEDKIAAWLSRKTISTTHLVMQGALGIEMKDQSKAYKNVGRILKQLGWETKRLWNPVTKEQGRYLIRAGADEDKLHWADVSPQVTGDYRRPDQSVS